MRSVARQLGFRMLARAADCEIQLIIQQAWAGSRRRAIAVFSGKRGIGRLIMMLVLGLGGGEAGCVFAETQTFDYDALGRLHAAYHRDGPLEGHLITVAHDAADNRQVYSEYTVLVTLQTGQSATSPDGRFTLLMQGDGNLVLYWNGVGALWSTVTGGSNITAKFQADGNLVLYTPGGSSIWQSGTGGNWAAKLFVQDDGNLVIYRGDGVAIWSSNTGGH